MAAPLGTLLYASFGPGSHVSEAVMSILSALPYRSVRSGSVGITLYTDNAEPFKDLPIRIVPICQDTAKAWRGPDDYVYNVKTQALLQTLRQTSGPVALLDGDTYFRRDPVRLFRRISPGRAVMHVRECSLGQIHEDGQIEPMTALTGNTYVSRRGDVLALGRGMPCWNSGVVGIHAADLDLVEETIALTAHIKQLSNARISEQLAFALLLERYTKLRGCRDVVFHYWWYPVRRDVAKALPKLLPPLKGVPPTDRWAALFPHRPHYPPKVHVKRWIRTKVLAPVGLRKREYPMS